MRKTIVIAIELLSRPCISNLHCWSTSAVKYKLLLNGKWKFCFFFSSWNKNDGNRDKELPMSAHPGELSILFNYYDCCDITLSALKKNLSRSTSLTFPSMTKESIRVSRSRNRTCGPPANFSFNEKELTSFLHNNGISCSRSHRQFRDIQKIDKLSRIFKFILTLLIL